MPSTPLYGLPAPDLPDLANGPQQILAAMQAVENLLSVGILKMVGGQIQISDPVGATNPVTLQWYNAHVKIGAAVNAPAAGGLPAGSIYYGY
jgi:hypothetical protein